MEEMFPPWVIPVLLFTAELCTQLAQGGRGASSQGWGVSTVCWDPRDNQEVQCRLSHLNCLLKDWILQETLKMPEILSTSTAVQGPLEPEPQNSRGLCPWQD